VVVVVVVLMVCLSLFSRCRRVGVELFNGDSVARPGDCVNKQFKRLLLAMVRARWVLGF
jgi:hypothetical protein